MNETLILKGLNEFKTTEHTEYTERKMQEKDENRNCAKPLILKGLRGVETTGWLTPRFTVSFATLT